MKIFPFTRTMNVEHSLVTTIRGKSLEDTDLVGILEALRAHAAMGIVQIYRDEAAIVLDISYSEPSEVDELHREVIRFDLTSLLPVSADGFVSGNLVQHFVFDEYVINAGLPRELFNVRYDARDLSDDGIPTIANMPVRPVDVEESRYPVD